MTAILLFAFCLQFLTAHTGYSQGLKDEIINLEVKDQALVEVFQQIEKQTDFRFAYNVASLNKYQVSLESGKRSLEETLNLLLKDKPLKYKVVKDKFIVLSSIPTVERLPSVNLLNRNNSISLLAKKLAINISGIVTNDAGEPLIGVNVLVQGTDKGTATDFDGRFVLNDLDEQAVLLVSYIGYQTQEIPLNGRRNLTITLTEDSQTLDELVVVGYGTQKKVNLTGAVEVISDDQIVDRPATTVSQILQGQSPGLSLETGSDGYEPGAKLNVSVRGIGSLNGGSPYVLIDGFPGDMDLLNPEDVESISVLKDAAASAIYGARAPYGVILITTKSGKRDQPISFTYSNNIAISESNSTFDQLDSYTFARYMNEAGDNWGGRSYTNDVVDRIIAYQNKDWDYLSQFVPDGATHFETVAGPDGRWARGNSAHADYDWMDEIYGFGFNQRHNISVKGGSDKATYYLSGGFQDQNGVLNYGTDTYKRFNIMGKINAKVTDWMDFRYETRFVKSPREKFNGGLYYPNNSTYTSTFRQISRQLPTQGYYDPFGNLNGTFTVDLDQGGTNLYETTENWQTLATEIRPLKGWKINADFAYQNTGVEGTVTKYTMYRFDVEGNKYPTFSSSNQIGRSKSTQNYWVSNVYTSYDLSILDKHNFFVMAGMQYEYNKYSYLDASKLNLIVQEIPSLETATGDPIAYESLYDWSTQGYFSRFIYNYDEKYLFEANVRYDGTSRFKDGNRSGFFPSFSMGWNIDKEPFWKNIENVVNTFKIRGSWGQLGNQQVGLYSDLALIPLETGKLDWIFDQGSNRPIGYTSIPRLVSPSLTWETATTTNVGINSTFFDSKLNFDFDVFERTTENMIGPSEPVPGLLGTNVPQSNNAKLQSRGWELSLRYAQTVQGKDFDWFVSFNLSDVKTKVTEYLNPSGLISSWYPGKEVGEIWGYQAKDLFQTAEEVQAYTEDVNLSFIFNSWVPGDVKYLDSNGDGAVNSGANTIDNPGDLSIIGNNTPRFLYGLSGGVNYKGFDLSLMFRGVGKRDYFFNDASTNIRFWGLQRLPFTALSPQHLDYFRDQPGDKYAGLYEGDANINLDAYWPRPYAEVNQNGKNRKPSTKYLVNAAYLRLQNVQLGYEIDKNLLEKVKIKKLRIYVAGENLFTKSSMLDGIDPSAIGVYGAGLTYGSDKVYSVGVNLSW
ncbi:TonB-dependent receptor [Membranihabitans marinus]